MERFSVLRSSRLPRSDPFTVAQQSSVGSGQRGVWPQEVRAIHFSGEFAARNQDGVLSYREWNASRY